MVYRSNLLFIIFTFRGIIFSLATVFAAIFLFFLVIVFFVIITFNVLESVIVFKV